MTNLVAQWNKTVSDLLVGKTITGVSYTTDAELEQLGWYERGVVLELNGGEAYLMVSRDDEGNGPGALLTTFGEHSVIPVVPQ